jgi:hypothetical protein
MAWVHLGILGHNLIHRICVEVGKPSNGLQIALPKNSARKKIPLNSICLRLIKALAHNLFHKICEERF